MQCWMLGLQEVTNQSLADVSLLWPWKKRLNNVSREWITMMKMRFYLFVLFFAHYYVRSLTFKDRAGIWFRWPGASINSLTTVLERMVQETWDPWSLSQLIRLPAVLSLCVWSTPSPWLGHNRVGDTLIIQGQGLPGGPVVRTLHFHCHGLSSIPG